MGGHSHLLSWVLEVVLHSGLAKSYTLLLIVVPKTRKHQSPTHSKYFLHVGTFGTKNTALTAIIENNAVTRDVALLRKSKSMAAHEYLPAQKLQYNSWSR